MKMRTADGKYIFTVIQTEAKGEAGRETGQEWGREAPGQDNYEKGRERGLEIKFYRDDYLQDWGSTIYRRVYCS